MHPLLSKDQLDRVFSILVAHAGAAERDRESFRQLANQCREFRFQGHLGFGGKFYRSHDRIWINYYPEDCTPERNAIVQLVNSLLSQLFKDVNAQK